MNVWKLGKCKKKKRRYKLKKRKKKHKEDRGKEATKLDALIRIQGNKSKNKEKSATPGRGTSA